MYEAPIKDLNFVFSTTIRSRKYSKDVFTPDEGIKFAKKLYHDNRGRIL